jgi:hypothetical protein
MTMTYTSDTVGDSFALDFLVAVPEPGSLLLGALGGALVLGLRRSRRRAPTI